MSNHVVSAITSPNLIGEKLVVQTPRNFVLQWDKPQAQLTALER